MTRDIEISSLRQILDADVGGRLYWRARKPEQFCARFPDRACDIWNAKYSGKEAFTTSDHLGYRRGSIFDRRYLAHRVVWALTHGEWPKAEIDHIDGNPANNMPNNLRAATRAENCQNITAGRRNKSGHLGVFFEKRRNRWRAVIAADGRNHHIGEFASKDAAAAAYAAAKAKLHTFQPIGRD